MTSSSSHAVRPIVLLLIAVAVGIAAYVILGEQASRSDSQDSFEILTTCVETGESLTPSEVHQRLSREPDVSRRPGAHKMVEEYHFKSQLGAQIIYAYYRTGATELLEAVSINQTIPAWENATSE